MSGSGTIRSATTGLHFNASGAVPERGAEASNFSGGVAAYRSPFELRGSVGITRTFDRMPGVEPHARTARLPSETFS